ncbi:hypothetical protein HK097_008567 [Rhizophlyctis rosea]|uniref:Signal recognition particle receptor subunit beta n=1 Tax=Rhizophlyctis rosea TaxID=64517 RepID=A0AAD5SI54_9FUNG|nr:hypothetical protein HK097_008567 [Rhizophlyctis rosea]
MMEIATSASNLPLIAAVLSLLLLVIVGAIVYRLKSTDGKRDTFLITGLSDSGKTVLYYRLQHEEEVAKPRLVHIVDLPGHEKLRFRFSEFTPITKGIVFILDSTTLNRNIRSVAEYLYDILVNKHVQKREVPILVLCNKNDLLLALGKEKVQELVEGEIDRLRATRAAGVEAQDEDRNGGDDFLGYENEAFKFEHVPNAVTFVSCSLIGDDDFGGVYAVGEFIANLT